jgi:hypothetical protein
LNHKGIPDHTGNDDPDGYRRSYVILSTVLILGFLLWSFGPTLLVVLVLYEVGPSV